MELEPRVAILQDLRLQTFDSIRFASYRTASKLRYIQKSTNLHLVDIWNVIEAFRENGLNTLEPQSEVSVARLETLVSSLYHNLNKRLPTAQQVPVDSKAGLLLNWLLAAYTSDNSGKIRVFSIKVALATMCSGKLVDKLRYIFSQISDGAGQLVPWKLGEFLREVLALPAAVYESPTFHYKKGLEEEIFPAEQKVTVNDFMATLMSEPGPSCLVWLPLLHRLATVETIVHPTICSVCHKENFTGFRYRCQRCHAYQLCQECFWHGKTSLNHQNDHEVKEYSSYKSPSKQIGHSLRKSFRCVPEKTTQVLPRFPEQPEKTLNLSHIVPPSPLPSHNGFSAVDSATLLAHGSSTGTTSAGGVAGLFDRSSTLDSRATGRSLDSATAAASISRVAAASANDEEHRLIARYAARLAQENRAPTGAIANMEHGAHTNSLGSDNSRAQRELIVQLEAKNKEIMREIARLRRQQEAEQINAPENPALINELRALRQRKGELEGHLGALQDSRRQLMEQLEGLMRMLKNQQQTASPRSTPNSSPRSGKSPPMPGGNVGGLGASIGVGGNAVGSMSVASMQQQQQQQQAAQHSLLGGAGMLRSQQHQQHQQQQQQQSTAAFNQNQLEQLNQISNEVRAAFNGTAIDRSNTHGDADKRHVEILNAEADNITSAISTLVNDLNAEQHVVGLTQPRFILPIEMRHIEGGESSPTEELIDLVEEIDSFEGIFQMDEEYETEAAGDIEDDLLQHLEEQQLEQLMQQQAFQAPLPMHANLFKSNNFLNKQQQTKHAHNHTNFNNFRYKTGNHNNNNHLLINHDDTDLAAAQAFDADEQAQINRIMGYRNYPQFLIDDEHAGFPALHEIDFDETQSYVEWNEKPNSNSHQWQEQFAQWSLNTQKN